MDIEDGDAAEVTINAPLLKQYKRNLEAFLGGVRDFCTERGIVHIFTTTSVPFDHLVLSYLRKRGLLR